MSELVRITSTTLEAAFQEELFDPEVERTKPADASQHGSEVARLLNQITTEHEAALRGFSGLAEGTTRHTYITKRMERVGELEVQLRELVGDKDKSMALVIEAMNAPEQQVFQGANP